MIYYILKYYSYIYITSLQNNNLCQYKLNYHLNRKIDWRKKRKKYDIITDVIKHRSMSRKNIFTRGGGKKLHRRNCNDATKNHHVRSMEFIPPIVSLLYDSEIHFSSGISPVFRKRITAPFPANLPYFR